MRKPSFEFLRHDITSRSMSKLMREGLAKTIAYFDAFLSEDGSRSNARCGAEARLADREKDLWPVCLGARFAHRGGRREGAEALQQPGDLFGS
jgi:hypothetical protein